VNFRQLQWMTDPTIDLAAEPKWDVPYRWLTDLQPLSPDTAEQYPWNWAFNFNWLRGHDVDSLSLIKTQEAEVAKEVKRFVSSTEHMFLSFIKKTKGYVPHAGRKLPSKPRWTHVPPRFVYKFGLK